MTGAKVVKEISPEVAALRLKALTDTELEFLATIVDNYQIVVVCVHGGRVDNDLLSTLTGKRETVASLPFHVTRATFMALRGREYLYRVSPEAVQRRIDAVKDHDQSVMGGEAFQVFQHSMHDHYYAPTIAANLALANNRDRLCARVADRDADIDHPRIVIARRVNNGLNVTVRHRPGAGLAYRIVRETASRIYVADLLPDDRTKEFPGKSSGPAVKGYGANRWIERDDVLCLDASLEQWMAMRTATQGYDESLAQAKGQMEDELAPIIRRNAERKVQLLAELEDSFAEAKVAPREANACL